MIINFIRNRKIYEGRFIKTPFYLRILGFPKFRRAVTSITDFDNYCWEYSETDR